MINGHYVFFLVVGAKHLANHIRCFTVIQPHAHWSVVFKYRQISCWNTWQKKENLKNLQIKYMWINLILGFSNEFEFREHIGRIYQHRELHKHWCWWIREVCCRDCTHTPTTVSLQHDTTFTVVVAQTTQ